jgi:hypothetical protein
MIRKTIFFLLPVTLTFLIACQREPNEDLDEVITPPGSTDSLLVRIESVDDFSDSMVLFYEYDVNDRLVKIINQYIDPSTGVPGLIEYTYDFTRNAAGNITTSVWTIPFQGDTIPTYYEYEAGKCKFLYNDWDTTYCVYEADGRLKALENRVPVISGGHKVKSTTLYYYDAARNITRIESKHDYGTGLGLETTHLANLKHDNKISPFVFDPIDFVPFTQTFGNIMHQSPSNIIEEKETQTGIPQMLETYSSYTYGTDNKPKTEVFKDVTDSPVDHDTAIIWSRYIYRAK